jgi:hypothetical protein
MATSDLQSELSRAGFKVDKAMEKKLCIAVLQQLQDISGDISALAVKWRVSQTTPLVIIHFGNYRVALLYFTPSDNPR